MQTIVIQNGRRQVVALRNDDSSKWTARLYVNNGQTATLESGRFKTEKGLRSWATKKLS